MEVSHDNSSLLVYADWYTEQRNGVKIDMTITPTIQGIQRGRDEVLQAALDCLRCSNIASNSTSKQTENDSICFVYPNPADGTVHVRFNKVITRKTVVSLFDMSGTKCYNYDLAAFQNNIDISVKSFPDGIYHLRITNAEDGSITKKVVIMHH